MTSTPDPNTTAVERPVALRANDILRFLLEIFAIVSLGIWGFVGWPLPWNIVVGIGAPVLAILLWALFRSPKAVLHADPFVKAIVELVVMGSAAFAWWSLGQPIVALVFAVVATVSGVINGRREFA
ncbi:YrdB family protein [Leifsonia sp. McL0607]|uniref:YrdB family protein n=1 Tax=Leifsonia sp. McL0607 TaxID=3415672 RepID=UPI003CE887A0